MTTLTQHNALGYFIVQTLQAVGIHMGDMLPLCTDVYVVMGKLPLTGAAVKAALSPLPEVEVRHESLPLLHLS